MMQDGGLFSFLPDENTLKDIGNYIVSIPSKLKNIFFEETKQKSPPAKQLSPYDIMKEVKNNADNNFMKKWNASDFYDSYKNIKKPLLLKTGRFTGASVDPSMINELVKAAEKQKIDPWLMVSLAGRESTFGSGAAKNENRKGSREAIVSGWNVAENYQPYQLERFLADKKVPGVVTDADNHGWFFSISNLEDVNKYLKKHPELINEYKKKLESTPDIGKKTAYDLAAEFIKKRGVKKYNPGDAGYSKAIAKDMEILKKDKAMRSYMKSLGYKYGGAINNEWEIVKDEELPIAKGGTKVKPPLPISDYNEYVRRNQLYQDSLNLYNATNPLINPNASTMNAFGDSFNRLTSYNRQAPQLITNSFSTCTTGTCGKNTSTAQRQVYQMPVQPVTYQPKPAPSRPKVTTKPTVKNTVTPKPVVKQEQPTQKLLQEKPVIKKEIPVEMIEPKPKKILYYKYGSNEPVYAEKKYGGNINSEWEIVEDEYLYEMKEGGKTPAWQRKEGKSPSGGLNAKGRASYNRANPGSNLKAPQPQGGPRKKSFCARMKGHKKKNTSAKTANDPNSRINLALRKWKC